MDQCTGGRVLTVPVLARPHAARLTSTIGFSRASGTAWRASSPPEWMTRPELEWGVPAFPAAVVDTIVRFGRSCLGGLHVDWQDGHSGVAPWLTFRSGLRSRWLLWLGLALLVGATAGGVMAGFAGARRMASAHDRFLDRQRAYDVLVDIDCDPDQAPTSSPARPDTSCLDDIRRLPSVADLTIVEGFAGFITTADGRSVQPYAGEDPCPIGAGSVQLIGDRSGRLGVELNEIRIVAGRRADPAAADEVVISKAIADRVGLAPGSVLQVSLFAGVMLSQRPVGMADTRVPAGGRYRFGSGRGAAAVGGVLRERPCHACLRHRAGAFSGPYGVPWRSR